MQRRFEMNYWGPVVVWMTFIFWMSTGMFSSENTSHIIGPILDFLFPAMPVEIKQLIHGLIRKAGHVTEYFVLGILCFRAFRGRSSKTWRLRWTLYAILWTALFALTDEFHQSFVAERTASIIDVGLDSAGGVLSQAAVFICNTGRRTGG